MRSGRASGRVGWRTSLALALLLGIGGCTAALLKLRSEFQRSTGPGADWSETSAKLKEVDGFVVDPRPLGGLEQCYGFQDFNCTTLVHYRAEDAARAAARNGFNP